MLHLSFNCSYSVDSHQPSGPPRHRAYLLKHIHKFKRVAIPLLLYFLVCEYERSGTPKHFTDNCDYIFNRSVLSLDNDYYFLRFGRSYDNSAVIWKRVDFLNQLLYRKTIFDCALSLGHMPLCLVSLSCLWSISCSRRFHLKGSQLLYVRFLKLTCWASDTKDLMTGQYLGKIKVKNYNLFTLLSSFLQTLVSFVGSSLKSMSWYNFLYDLRNYLINSASQRMMYFESLVKSKNAQKLNTRAASPSFFQFTKR